MRANGYIMLMLKHLSARGSLFLFVRTHHHLQYYFNLNDTRLAANQHVFAGPSGFPLRAKVVEIHRVSPAVRSQRP